MDCICEARVRVCSGRSPSFNSIVECFSSLPNDHTIHFEVLFPAVYLLCLTNVLLFICVDFEDLFDDDDIQ